MLYINTALQRSPNTFGQRYYLAQTKPYKFPSRAHERNSVPAGRIYEDENLFKNASRKYEYGKKPAKKIYILFKHLFDTDYSCTLTSLFISLLATQLNVNPDVLFSDCNDKERQKSGRVSFPSALESTGLSDIWLIAEIFS